MTRSAPQAGDFTRLLRAQGANVLEIPTIEIQPRSAAELDSILQTVPDYDWVFFTSVNAVEVLLGRGRRLKLPVLLDTQRKPEICAIGPATAEKLRAFGSRVDLVPSRYQAEGILESFLEQNRQSLSELKILIPRASRARSILPDRLRKVRARVDVPAVYDTVVPVGSRERLAQSLRSQTPDLITFTSSSTVRHFVDLVEDPERLKQYYYAAIGPITADTAEEYGLQIAVQARKSTIPDLVKEIVQYFRGKASQADDLPTP